MRVADLLDTLFPADNSKLRSSALNKLLILDSNRMDLNWSLGLLYNTFAERLPAVVGEKNIPGLVVLNSASPGQIGWSAPELRDSVFGFFLWKGLNGAARTGKNGKIISLRDLCGYLKNNVSLWVSEKRADDQTPMLIPPNADFPLVYARSQAREAGTKAELSRDPRWDEVQKLWIRHATLREKQVGLSHPQEWEKFQQGLLRLEQLLQAGSAYETQFAGQLARSKNDLDTLERSDAGRRLAAFSLPLKKVFGQGPSTAEGKFLSPPWKEPEPAKAETKEKESNQPPAAKAGTDAKNSESEKQPASKTGDKAEDKNTKSGAKESRDKKPAPQPPPPPVRYSYLAASSAAWDWLTGNSPGENDVQRALHYVDGGVNRPRAAEADLVEIQFLRMLVEYLDPIVWSASPQSVKNAIPREKRLRPPRRPGTFGHFIGFFRRSKRAISSAARPKIDCSSAMTPRSAKPRRNGAKPPASPAVNIGKPSRLRKSSPMPIAVGIRPTATFLIWRGGFFRARIGGPAAISNSSTRSKPRGGSPCCWTIGRQKLRRILQAKSPPQPPRSRKTSMSWRAPIFAIVQTIPATTRKSLPGC